jgi:hypothetical protein
MRLNTNISDGNRLFFELHPTPAFLNIYEYIIYIYIIIHNGQCMSVRACCVDISEMCIAEKLSPDRIMK